MIITVLISVYAFLIVTALIITLVIKFEKDHSVNKNSWHIKLFNILICDEYVYPKNVCSYFWRYVLSILLLPISIFGVIINVFLKDKMEQGTGIFASLLVWVMFIASYVFGFEVLNVTNSILAFISGFFSIIIILALSLGTIFILVKILEKRISPSYKPKTTPLLFTKIKSWKERNCPIINWK